MATMTPARHAFLLFVKNAYVNSSAWLTAAGKPATAPMQVLPFFEVSGNGGSIRITSDDFKAIEKYVAYGLVTATSLSLNEAGRKVLEDMA